MATLEYVSLIAGIVVLGVCFVLSLGSFFAKKALVRTESSASPDVAEKRTFTRVGNFWFLLAALALVLVTVSIVARIVSSGRGPFSNMYETSISIAWGIIAMGFYFYIRYRALALSTFANLIALGQQDRVICGGAQEINWESMCSFDGLGAFSIRTDNPEAASRPFDIHRDGLVPSGGAAALVLERYDLAKKRGVKILGEIIGYAFSSDGFNLSVPSHDGLARAMGKALKTAGIGPSDIDYICAHATSTPAGDAAEADNIISLFGEKSPWVSSTKSMTGHELWMSGASQVVYSVIMAQQAFIAPNINFERPDKSSEKLKIVEKTIDSPPKKVLCNSAGFGGTNACLIIGTDL